MNLLDLIAFIFYTLFLLFIGAIIGVVVLFPKSPDPGIGYRWDCGSTKVVIQYWNDHESYLAGNLCKKVKIVK